MSRAAAVRALLLSLGLAVPALAHDRTVSYSTIELAGPRARITLRMSALDVSRLPWTAGRGAEIDARLGAYFAEHLTLSADGAPCPVTRAPQRQPGGDDRVAYTWEATCPTPRALQVRTTLLQPEAPSHLHFVRLLHGGGPATERVLSEAAPLWTLGDVSAPAPVGTTFVDFVRLGVEHILSGTDHLVFLLGLLLLGGTLRDLVRIVTGFTVAHSITLALAVFGLARPPSGAIEALIGLSIALVAAENLWLASGRRPAVRYAIALALLALAAAATRGRGGVPALTLAGLALFAVCYLGLLARVARPAPLRAAVAFVFGLVHGFGFAGVLLEAALPSERLARALFGFNLGVELGQVACVLLLWPLLQAAFRVGEGRLQRPLVEYGSAAILAVGVFWFVSRSYG
ncbi:MAG: HupE/UreJ family protein [Deltaproteobacteria bacterium]|nr:HupE/UreJ family protein [Deltaproteobacteria bacterium]